MPLGIMASQICHAAGESSPRLSQGTYAVILCVETAAKLLEISNKLTILGIAHVLIRESDPPYAGEPTAIGVEPKPRSELKRWFSSLPLLCEAKVRQAMQKNSRE
jgi:peptidyl-tRNA hydrolase